MKGDSILKMLLRILLCLPVLALFVNPVIAQQEKHSEKYEVFPKELSDGTLYGAELDANITPTPMTDIFASPDKYEKQTVIVEGNVFQVCQNMGCWTVITDGTNEMRAMSLHKFFMPKDMKIGSKAVVQGEFTVKEITEEQAKGYEEESGKPSGKEIKGPQKMYMIKMTGIKILK